MNKYLLIFLLVLSGASDLHATPDQTLRYWNLKACSGRTQAEERELSLLEKKLFGHKEQRVSNNLEAPQLPKDSSEKIIFEQDVQGSSYDCSELEGKIKDIREMCSQLQDECFAQENLKLKALQAYDRVDTYFKHKLRELELYLTTLENTLEQADQEKLVQCFEKKIIDLESVCDTIQEACFKLTVLELVMRQVQPHDIPLMLKLPHRYSLHALCAQEIINLLEKNSTRDQAVSKTLEKILGTICLRSDVAPSSWWATIKSMMMFYQNHKYQVSPVCNVLLKEELQAFFTVMRAYQKRSVLSMPELKSLHCAIQKALDDVVGETHYLYEQRDKSVAGYQAACLSLASMKEALFGIKDDVEKLLAWNIDYAHDEQKRTIGLKHKQVLADVLFMSFESSPQFSEVTAHYTKMIQRFLLADKQTADSLYHLQSVVLELEQIKAQHEKAILVRYTIGNKKGVRLLALMLEVARSAYNYTHEKLNPAKRGFLKKLYDGDYSPKATLKKIFSRENGKIVVEFAGNMVGKEFKDNRSAILYAASCMSPMVLMLALKKIYPYLSSNFKQKVDELSLNVQALDQASSPQAQQNMADFVNANFDTVCELFEKYPEFKDSLQQLVQTS